MCTHWPISTAETIIFSLLIILSIIFLTNRLVICSIKWQELWTMSISSRGHRQTFFVFHNILQSWYWLLSTVCSCSLISCYLVCFAAIWMETTWQSSPRQTSLVSNTSESCKWQPRSLIQLRARLNMYLYNWDLPLITHKNHNTLDILQGVFLFLFSLFNIQLFTNTFLKHNEPELLSGSLTARMRSAEILSHISLLVFGSGMMLWLSRDTWATLRCLFGVSVSQINNREGFICDLLTWKHGALWERLHWGWFPA